MSSNDRLGGVIHTYQKYDPANFPSPTAPPPDLVSNAFEHLLFYGNTRRLTEKELARAVEGFPDRVVQQWHLLQAAATGGALFWFLLGFLAGLLWVRLTRRGG